MSKFPAELDDDESLPIVNDNITEVGADAINALRDAVFSIETEIGLGASGSAGSVASRLSESLEPDGTIKSSALTSLGLVTLPITNEQISNSAQIDESKLALSYSTTALYNSLVTQKSYIDNLLLFSQGSGSKIEPHISGASYNHVLSHIKVSNNSTDYLKNRNDILRDNSNLYSLLNDINSDLVVHEKANATASGEVPPANYAHVASGIHVNTSNFSFIPQTATDLQQITQFIDNSNIFILGTRIQTFYTSGIARTARASTLTNSERGQSIVPSTPVITYFLNGGASAPVDNIDNGDDIIEFSPDAASISNSSFDAKFAAIKIGDIITVNYGGFEIANVIKEKKIIVNGGNKRYVVRIDRKNILAGTYSAKIDKPLFNNNKSGVLALAQANAPTNVLPSLIAGNPRGAQVLGIDFNPDQFDIFHYNLWLVLYPNGNPADGFINLAAIDVTGNKGRTPGKYTLSSIVEATNNSFRKAGFNYRFIAFSYKGEFGIMLAEPYGNASFSITSGILSPSGTYDNSLSNTVYINNVLGTPGYDYNDALGIGPSKANLASPPYSATYINSDVAQTPTKLFIPLARMNYYINGVERERFNLEPGQILDTYGDGYWNATITTKTIIPGTRVEIGYKIEDDLSDVRWKPGQTIVVQQGEAGSIVDFGRFFIKDLQFNNCPGPTAYTNLVVYDGIHSTGSSPYLSSPVGTKVQIYFNSDSIGFSSENASDFTAISSPFKRSFEIYINQDGYTFSHERARFDISGSNITVNNVSLYGDSNLTGINIYAISPKLRGYIYSSVNKINLQISEYNQATGEFEGYLCRYDGITISNQGPVTNGKKGEIVRFYDETNVDYIDFIFDIESSIPQINSNKYIDIQLFPTLSLDEELMLLGTCQVNDTTKKINYLRDTRQFGNISEQQLSSSALEYIAAPNHYLHENGVIKGLAISGEMTGDGYNTIHIDGGTALINGNIINVNDEFISIPIVKEVLYPAFSTTISTIKWFVCLNDKGKYEVIASTDFDNAGGDASSYNGLALDHTRIFYVKNPNYTAGSAYPIKGTYFSNLVLNYKRLMPIAVINAPVIASGINYIIDPDNVVVSDARRFISEGHSGMNGAFSLGSHSNFRNVESMVTWMTELNKYKSSTVNLINKIGDIIKVQDSINVSGKTFAFGNKVTFVGDGGRFIMSTDDVVMTDIGLDNLRIDISLATGITLSGTRNTMNNCFINYTGPSGSGYPIVVNTASRLVATHNVFKKNSNDVGAYINNLGGLNVVVVGNVYESDTLVNGTNTASANVSDG
jgi:hypothetical protein